MITEFEIEGLKSFGSPAQRVQFDALSCLIGANSSGKSNILFALEFIHNAVVQDIPTAINRLGGISEGHYKIQRHRKECKPLRLQIIIEWQTGVRFLKKHYELQSFDYEIELDVRGDSLPKIKKETLVSEFQKANKTFVFTLNRDLKKVQIDDPIIKREECLDIPEQEQGRLAVNAGFFALPCVFFGIIFNIGVFIVLLPMLLVNRIARVLETNSDVWARIYRWFCTI